MDFFARNCYRIYGKEGNTLSVDNPAPAHRMNHLSGVFSFQFSMLVSAEQADNKNEKNKDFRAYVLKVIFAVLEAARNMDKICVSGNDWLFHEHPGNVLNALINAFW